MNSFSNFIIKWMNISLLRVYVQYTRAGRFNKTALRASYSSNAEFFSSVYVTGDDTVSFLIVFCVSISVFHLDDR